jgi:hypothetical protein
MITGTETLTNSGVIRTKKESIHTIDEQDLKEILVILECLTVERDTVSPLETDALWDIITLIVEITLALEDEAVRTSFSLRCNVNPCVFVSTLLSYTAFYCVILSRCILSKEIKIKHTLLEEGPLYRLVKDAPVSVVRNFLANGVLIANISKLLPLFCVRSGIYDYNPRISEIHNVFSAIQALKACKSALLTGYCLFSRVKIICPSREYICNSKEIIRECTRRVNGIATISSSDSTTSIKNQYSGADPAVLPRVSEQQNEELSEEVPLNVPNDDLNTNGSCAICFESTEFVAFFPCGHVCSCIQCSKGFQDCPICRTPISQSVKIFMATV